MCRFGELLQFCENKDEPSERWNESNYNVDKTIDILVTIPRFILSLSLRSIHIT